MTFEEMLPHLKAGEKVVRTNWEGTELWVELVKPEPYHNDPVNPYFLIKTEDEAYSIWTPNVCDVLATDWVVVDALSE